MDRALPSEGKGRTFESSRVRHRSIVVVYTRTKNVEIIRLTDVSLAYNARDTIFEGLNCNFLRHNFYFLTGVSGAGKTSLLKLLYCGVKANKGEVAVFGKNVKELSTQKIPFFRQKIGLVFQDCHLLNHLTILENTLLPIIIQRKKSEPFKIQALELLDWVGIGKFAHSYPHQLSDGQRQRAALARAVISRPLLLLADEPTGNIDDAAAYKLMNLLQSLHENGTTIIFATHNRNLIRDFSYPEYHISQKKILLRTPQFSQEYYHGTS